MTNDALILFQLLFRNKNTQERGFPGGSVVNNPPVNAGDTGSIPDPGRYACCRAAKPEHC